MSQEIKEGEIPNQLTFTFPDNWDICKFDDTKYYREKIEKLDGIKSVDIIANDGGALQFIEVKDFRHHRIENKERQKSGELTIEVSQKFVNTLSALIGANRLNLSDFAPYYTPLLSSLDQKITVILFIERDEREHTLQRNKITLAHLQQKLKKLLIAYNIQCKVYDRDKLPQQVEWTVQ